MRIRGNHLTNPLLVLLLRALSCFVLQNYGVNATQYQIGLKYIAAFTALGCAAGSRTIFFPLQTSIVGSLADVAT